MKDKKHIDRLFQEKLKNFEATPGDSVWENISSELYVASKERKASPVWWRVAGIAAGLLLIVTLWTTLNDKDNITPAGDTTEQNIVDVESEKENTNGDEINSSNNKTDKLAGEDKSLNNENSPTSSSNNAVAATEEDQISPDTNNNDPLNSVSSTIGNRDPLSNTTSKESVKTGLDTPNNKGVKEEPVETRLSATNNKVTNQIEGPSLGNGMEKEKAAEVLKSDIPTGSVVDGNKGNGIETGLIKSTKENTETQKVSVTEETTEPSLTEEIASIEEDEIDEENEDFERWSAAPVVGPVYFNSLGNGSSIHPEFNNNSKTGDINLSYGITASYAINKKLTVRAGVHKVNLGYSTNNVVVYNNVETPINTPLLKLYKNIKMTEEAKSLAFISVSEFNFAQVPGPVSDFIRSSIDQKLGFIEIPVELKYNISDRKLGVNVIGGFSTLILSDNEVYSVDNGRSMLLGEATNLNSTSFSANFGLGFDLKLSDKINLNLEPVFKYQLNTFTDTTGNFKPFVIGVYSGLSFKF